MIVTMDLLAEWAEEDRGKPCGCGVADGEHVHVRKWRTLKGWSVRVNRVWRSHTGLWWMAVSAPRWFRDEVAADRHADDYGGATPL